jgi:dolichol kinase
MSDALLIFISILMLIAGLSFCVFLGHKFSKDWARDALHVGVALWTLVLPSFSSVLYPDVIVGLALLGVIFVPLASRKIPAMDRLQSAVSGGSDTWTGIVVYVFSYVVLTWLYPIWPMQSLAAMAALALGDGIGGMIGRLFGRVHYSLPWTKPRSLEGSLAVAIGAAMGMTILKVLLGQMSTLSLGQILIAGLVAAAAEALSPKSMDNFFLPFAVFISLL